MGVKLHSETLGCFFDGGQTFGEIHTYEIGYIVSTVKSTSTFSPTPPTPPLSRERVRIKIWY